MENGKYIRYREKGEPGKFGGKHGDLYVRVVVEPVVSQDKKEPDPVNGRDINCTLKLTNEEWVKGVEKEKEVTIDGMSKRILVKVPPAIQNGAAIRYKGNGEAGKFGGQNGDLYVRVVVDQKDSYQKKEEKTEKSQTSETKENDNKNTDTSKAEEQSVPTNENTIPIHITFLEAAKGTEKEVILPKKIQCKKCKGTGKIKKKNCSACQGNGVESAPQKIRVKIPAGIDEGQLLRLKNKDDLMSSEVFREFFGNAAKFLNHDWYAKIHIEKHPKFERKGYDIYSTENLPFYIGSGRMVGIDTLDGKQYYNVTKEIKDGSQICLKNKGIPKVNNPSDRGNHYVTWKKK